MILLVHAGFHDNRPYFDTAENDEIIRHPITARNLTLTFDTRQRFCNGWHDLQTGESHTCPSNASIEAAYTQCPACQRRTGFNPAFYHAKSVSEQQTKRNQEPHVLYLAYFAPDVVKVGISHEARGLARLEEQGARAALILDSYPSALIARQYEAKLASFEGIVEHLTQRKKRELWSCAYEVSQAETTLRKTSQTAAERCGSAFSKNSFHSFEDAYFFEPVQDLSSTVFVDDQSMISGHTVGCVGTNILMKNNDQLISLSLKSFVGYQLTVKDEIVDMELPAVQPSLF